MKKYGLRVSLNFRRESKKEEEHWRDSACKGLEFTEKDFLSPLLSKKGTTETS